MGLLLGAIVLTFSLWFFGTKVEEYKARMAEGFIQEFSPEYTQSPFQRLVGKWCCKSEYSPLLADMALK